MTLGKKWERLGQIFAGTFIFEIDKNYHLESTSFVQGFSWITVFNRYDNPMTMVVPSWQNKELKPRKTTYYV